MHLLKHAKQTWNACGINKANFDFNFSCTKSEHSHIHITIIQSTHYCPVLSPLLFVQVNIFHWLLWMWTSKNFRAYFKEVFIFFIACNEIFYVQCFLIPPEGLNAVLLMLFNCRSCHMMDFDYYLLITKKV